jgi:hypothetical protein
MKNRYGQGKTLTKRPLPRKTVTQRLSRNATNKARVGFVAIRCGGPGALRFSFLRFGVRTKRKDVPRRATIRHFEQGQTSIVPGFVLESVRFWGVVPIGRARAGRDTLAFLAGNNIVAGRPDEAAGFRIRHVVEQTFPGETEAVADGGGEGASGAVALPLENGPVVFVAHEAEREAAGLAAFHRAEDAGDNAVVVLQDGEHATDELADEVGFVVFRHFPEDAQAVYVVEAVYVEMERDASRVFEARFAVAEGFARVFALEGGQIGFALVGVPAGTALVFRGTAGVAAESVAIILSADAATVGAASFGDEAGAVGAAIFGAEFGGHRGWSPYAYSIRRDGRYCGNIRRGRDGGRDDALRHQFDSLKYRPDDLDDAAPRPPPMLRKRSACWIGRMTVPLPEPNGKVSGPALTPMGTAR